MRPFFMLSLISSSYAFSTADMCSLHYKKRKTRLLHMSIKRTFKIKPAKTEK